MKALHLRGALRIASLAVLMVAIAISIFWQTEPAQADHSFRRFDRHFAQKKFTNDFRRKNTFSNFGPKFTTQFQQPFVDKKPFFIPEQPCYFFHPRCTSFVDPGPLDPNPVQHCYFFHPDCTTFVVPEPALFTQPIQQQFPQTLHPGGFMY